MKRVKFWVSGHFSENAWTGWPDILHADVSWPPLEPLVDFCNFGTIDLAKRVKFGVSGNFLENAWREWPEILYADVSWPPPESIRLW